MSRTQVLGQAQRRPVSGMAKAILTTLQNPEMSASMYQLQVETTLKMSVT